MTLKRDPVMKFQQIHNSVTVLSPYTGPDKGRNNLWKKLKMAFNSTGNVEIKRKSFPVVSTPSGLKFNNFDDWWSQAAKSDEIMNESAKLVIKALEKNVELY